MTDDQSPFADTPDGVGLTVAGYLLCVPRGLKMGPARDGINAAVSAIVSAARKEEREALESRLSLAEKVVEAAEEMRVALDDLGWLERERANKARAALRAALSAYRSAK